MPQKGDFFLSENSAFALCVCLVISLTYEDQVYELKQLKQLLKVKHKTMNIYVEVLLHSIMKIPQTQWQATACIPVLLKILAICDLGGKKNLEKYIFFQPSLLDEMIFQPYLIYLKTDKFLSSGFFFI